MSLLLGLVVYVIGLERFYGGGGGGRSGSGAMELKMPLEHSQQREAP